MSRREEFIALAEDAGGRLDAVIAARIPDLSRTAAAELTREGRVSVDGRLAKPSHRIREGERIEIEVGVPPARTVAPENIPLEIVYHDADIAVIDKPAGLVVHPAPGHWSGTLANALLAAFPTVSNTGERERPGIVHRLDKETSGLIAVAVSPRGLNSLHRQIARREARRSYLALARGKVEPPEGIIDAPIGRDPADRKRMAPFGVAAREARTGYRVEEVLPGFTLLEATLETGRTHQIRVHMAAIGHPLAGDTVYGGPFLPGLDRQFLHAYKLCLRLPSSGDVVELESALPADLDAVLEQLRGISATPTKSSLPDGDGD
jgi:23S rRNA pseudouridine1911/1915/1917 synthase